MSDSAKIYILVYVDDIVVTGDNEAEIQKCVELICKKLLCRDLGELNFFLGLKCA